MKGVCNRKRLQTTWRGSEASTKYSRGSTPRLSQNFPLLLPVNETSQEFTERLGSEYDVFPGFNPSALHSFIFLFGRLKPLLLQTLHYSV